MTEPRLAGGPTKDEIMAVSLNKLQLRCTDTVLEIGCGTGKVSVALAQLAKEVFSVDLRPEAVNCATETAKETGVQNIEFFCMDAAAFLEKDQLYDCAIVGGTKHLLKILPVLVKKVKRTIVINAVKVSTLSDAVACLKGLGLFCEVVHVQVSRSHEIAGSIMFKPIDPVYIIVGQGEACS
jgi:cobalt-precorrin-6B (C15)-methyltransferase